MESSLWALFEGNHTQTYKRPDRQSNFKDQRMACRATLLLSKLFAYFLPDVYCRRMQNRLPDLAMICPYNIDLSMKFDWRITPCQQVIEMIFGECARSSMVPLWPVVETFEPVLHGINWLFTLAGCVKVCGYSNKFFSICTLYVVKMWSQHAVNVAFSILWLWIMVLATFQFTLRP